VPWRWAGCEYAQLPGHGGLQRRAAAWRRHDGILLCSDVPRALFLVASPALCKSDGDIEGNPNAQSKGDVVRCHTDAGSDGYPEGQRIGSVFSSMLVVSHPCSPVLP
jgi:hypothetical protein